MYFVTYYIEYIDANYKESYGAWFMVTEIK